MYRGVLYYITGTRHWPVLICSILSLRKFYDGPIGIMFPDDADDELFNRLSGDPILAPVIPVRFRQVKYRRHSGYMNKPRMFKASPFDSTVFFDADTLIVGSIDDMFVEPEDKVRLTKFAHWTTYGKTIKKRITKWTKAEPERVQRQLDKEFAAVNTGVLAFGSGLASEKFGDDWLMTTNGNPSFIADEIAAQLIYPEHECVLLDDRFNCSPRYGANRDKAVVWHFHGKKHLKPQAIELWWPVYQEAINKNIAGIRDWTPAGDGRLKEYLKVKGHL